MMDFAERGAVEKTFDDLLAHESTEFTNTDGAELVDETEELTPAGQLYTAGILTGILGTIRTFSDESPELAQDDLDEINQIVVRREREMVAHLIDGGRPNDVTDS